ncbi:hypothetical protein [Achromobacter kerstersii]
MEGVEGVEEVEVAVGEVAVEEAAVEEVAVEGAAVEEAAVEEAAGVEGVEDVMKGSPFKKTGKRRANKKPASWRVCVAMFRRALTHHDRNGGNNQGERGQGSAHETELAPDAAACQFPQKKKTAPESLSFPAPRVRLGSHRFAPSRCDPSKILPWLIAPAEPPRLHPCAPWPRRTR